MRIVIDARWIFDEISGIGLYTQELIRHLGKIDHENEYILLFDHSWLMDRTAEYTRYNTTTRFEARLVDYGVFSLHNQTRMPALLRYLAPAVYHSPNYMIPLSPFPRDRPGTTRCAVTIHDVIPLAFPDHAPRSKKRRLFPVYRALMKEVGRRADAILTVSEASRTEVIKHLALPPARADDVTVVYNGVSETYRPSIRDPAPRPPTVLYVGRFDPYKNLVGLVDAMAQVRQVVPTAVLKVIGPRDERYPEAPQRAEALGIDDAVEWAGYATDQELLAAYQEADVLALPSRYEGFGLPILEAMACGTPVVCGNQSSLPEIAGDAAVLFDPDDTSALAAALVDVLTDPGLAGKLRQQGLIRAAEFTWARSAEQTLAVYHRLGADS